MILIQTYCFACITGVLLILHIALATRLDLLFKKSLWRFEIICLFLFTAEERYLLRIATMVKNQ